MNNITQESAFAAKYHAEQISDKMLLVGYSHDKDDVAFWLADAEEKLMKLNALLGFKIERIAEPSARVEEYTDAEAVNGPDEWKSVEDDFWADAPVENEFA